MPLAINLKTLIVAQKSVYDEFMCPTTIEPTEVKCPTLYSYFNESCIFFDRFSSLSVSKRISVHGRPL